jgi:hypothetical protein
MFLKSFNNYKRRKNGGEVVEVFSPSDELCLLLLHLRHYLTDSVLGFIFSISKQTAGNIRRRLRKDLYNIMKKEISLKDHKWRTKNSINILHHNYTYILDGSEQEVKKAKRRIYESKYYSAKKKKHTINTLLVIATKKKKILYLSPSFPGSKNDPAIVHQTRSEWLDLLSPKEYGIGDSIFKFPDQTIRIHPPPKKFTPLHSAWSKHRVEVENVFAWIKNWKVCKYPLRNSFKACDKSILKLHHENWMIIAGFVNKFYNK